MKRRDRRKQAMAEVKTGRVRDKDFLKMKAKEDLDMMDNLLGVLSLTIEPSESRLWDEYGKNHTGFCVEFDPRLLLKETGSGNGMVSYNEELPEIHPTKYDAGMQSMLQWQFKLNKWSHESEYRSTIFKGYPLTEKERQYIAPANSIKRIILGALMPTAKEDELKLSLPTALKSVPIVRAKLISNKVIF
ncbi:MAG: DUF2971 domain-containing protein [Bacteroidota bacterium]